MKKTLMSNAEIDELGEAMIDDYYKESSITLTTIDIEAFITEYLKLKICYAKFAEDNYDRVGFFADGIRPLKIYGNGKIISRLYPINTIVIDPRVKESNGEGCFRFTLAHEAAHYILNKVNLNNVEASFKTEYDHERKYTPDELKDWLCVTEWLADKLAAALLMPEHLIRYVLSQYCKTERVTIYGDNIFKAEDKLMLRQMANQIGVSYQALVIRLRNLKLLEYHSLHEYLKYELQIGGI